MNKFFELIIVSFIALGIYLWVACSSDSIRIVDNNNADDDNGKYHHTKSNSQPFYGFTLIHLTVPPVPA